MNTGSKQFTKTMGRVYGKSDGLLSGLVPESFTKIHEKCKRYDIRICALLCLVYNKYTLLCNNRQN